MGFRTLTEQLGEKGTRLDAVSSRLKRGRASSAFDHTLKPDSRQANKPTGRDERTSGSIAKRRVFWRDIVRSWRSVADAVAWFKTQGIRDDAVGGKAWFVTGEGEQKLSIFGAGSGELLYDEILKDPRFRGRFTTFQLWLQPWRDYPKIVASWLTPEHAAQWAESYKLSPRKLVDSTWIKRSKMLIGRQGCKGLYQAILEDPRFRGGFAEFSRWWKRGSSDAELVRGWQTKQDVLVWAAEERVDTRCLSDETAFRSARRLIHKAILQDPRFCGSFKQFKSWLELNTESALIVSSWKDPLEATQWAAEYGISKADMCSPQALSERGLWSILEGVLTDPRFGGDFAIFRAWLGVSEEHAQVQRKGTFSDLIRNWRAPEDAISWATTKGISVADLGRRSWLIQVSKLPAAEGGIDESLEGLVEAILADPRFGGDFAAFRRWIGITNLSATVRSWKTPRDARAWARARGISWEAVLAGVRNSRRTSTGTVNRELVKAITSDQRFLGDLKRFIRWLQDPNVGS